MASGGDGLRDCKACDHPDRAKLDQYLAGGATLMMAEALFPPLTFTHLRKHRDQHMKNVVVRVQGDPVRIGRICQDLTDRCRMLMEQAIDEGAGAGQIIEYMKTLTRCVELEAKWTNVRAMVNPLDSIPKWQQLMGVLMAALEEHPEARRDVLRKIEDFRDQSTEH